MDSIDVAARRGLEPSRGAACGGRTKKEVGLARRRPYMVPSRAREPRARLARYAINAHARGEMAPVVSRLDDGTAIGRSDPSALNHPGLPPTAAWAGPCTVGALRLASYQDTIHTHAYQVICAHSNTSQKRTQTHTLTHTAQCVNVKRRPSSNAAFTSCDP